MFTILSLVENYTDPMVNTPTQSEVQIPGLLLWYSNPDPCRPNGVPDGILLRDLIHRITPRAGTEPQGDLPHVHFISALGDEDILAFEGLLLVDMGNMFLKTDGTELFVIQNSFGADNKKLRALFNLFGPPKVGLIMRLSTDMEGQVEEIDLNTATVLSSDPVPGKLLAETWIAGLSIRLSTMTQYIFEYLLHRGTNDEPRCLVPPDRDDRLFAKRGILCWYPSGIPSNLKRFLHELSSKNWKYEDAHNLWMKHHPVWTGFHEISISMLRVISKPGRQVFTFQTLFVNGQSFECTVHSYSHDVENSKYSKSLESFCKSSRNLMETNAYSNFDPKITVGGNKYLCGLGAWDMFSYTPNTSTFFFPSLSSQNSFYAPLRGSHIWKNNFSEETNDEFCKTLLAMANESFDSLMFIDVGLHGEAR